MKRVLLIDSSPAVRETFARVLAREYDLICRSGAEQNADIVGATAGIDLVIAGAGAAPWASELMRLAERNELAVLFLTDSETIAGSSVRGARLANLTPPLTPYAIKAAVAGLLSATARSQSARLRPHPPGVYLEFPFISRNNAHLAQRFVALSLPLMITGETGCGQDQVARAILAQAADGNNVLTLNAADANMDSLRRKRAELSMFRTAYGPFPALLIEGTERLSLPEQSTLLEFLDDVEDDCRRLLTTADADLLERVYRGEFLERLYQKLATLTLPLTPLRQRVSDIAALAGWFAGHYATALGLGDVQFTAGALERLRNYLWFGNVHEMERVIAQTLAIHGKTRVDATDLIFDVAALGDAPTEHAEPVDGTEEAGPEAGEAQAGLLRAHPLADNQAPASAAGPGLQLLVHELAHELKNPMVTIKTFAQLLAERYDDAAFRARFQDVVDSDIERMDELLSVLAEFAGFDPPRKHSLVLKEQLRSAIASLQEHCAKRKIRVGWKGDGHGVKIVADDAQLQYALKNTIRAVLSQARSGSEIEVALGKAGSLTISYLRDGERMPSLMNYLGDVSTNGRESLLPLRLMLAREIVERSGGRLDIDYKNDHREVVIMEFPVG